MKRISFLLTAIAFTLGPLSVQAQGITKTNLTTDKVHKFSPIPDKPDLHKKLAWVCHFTNLEVDPNNPPQMIQKPYDCVYRHVGYLNGPCRCCYPTGCWDGEITAFSLLVDPDEGKHQEAKR
jgi:hypothetical protein